MATADLSSIIYFLPILSFLVVAIVTYVALHMSKLIEAKILAAFVAFIVATIFVSASGPRNYVLVIIPWFAVVIVGMFFMLAITGFLGKDAGLGKKTIGTIFVSILGVIFIISALFVFSPYYGPYLPWNYGTTGNPYLVGFFDWIYSSSVGGAVLLLGISAVVGWLLVKAK